MINERLRLDSQIRHSKVSTLIGPCLQAIKESDGEAK